MEAKRIVRASVLRGRSIRPTGEREAAGHLLMAHGIALAGDARVVAAHAAVGSEPPTRPLIEALVARGVRVLLPVVTAQPELGWGDFVDWSLLVTSAMGLLEPEPSDGAASAAAGADLVLAPAVAVDRAGHRLGRGGGYFDRWLAERPPDGVVAVVYDDEVLDAVPHEPHDRLVGAALTPSGVIAFG